MLAAATALIYEPAIAQTATASKLYLGTNSIATSQSLTLDARVAPGVLGQVSFKANQQVLGTVSVDLRATEECAPTMLPKPPPGPAGIVLPPSLECWLVLRGFASLTIPGGTLVPGQYTVTASFSSADAAYGNSQSATANLMVTGTGGNPPLSSASSTLAHKFEYDADGNLTKTVQAPDLVGGNFATTNVYDSLGRRRSITNARNGAVQLTYDLRDELTQVTDPRSLSTQYQVSAMGGVTQQTSPDTGVTSNTYDVAGNLVTSTDARGFISSFSYDALDRPTLRSVRNLANSGTRQITWTYDQVGSGFSYGVGRLTTATTPEASTTFKYDPTGRATQVATKILNEGTRSVGYSYNSAGHITQLTYPSGRSVVYTYTDGLVTGVGLKAASGSTSSPLLSQIVTSPLGAPTAWRWKMASGEQTYAREFDTMGRIVRYPLGTMVRDLAYDAAGRILSYRHSDASTGSPLANLNQDFGYDELGRLLLATMGTSSWTYSYDANGNRTLLGNASGTSTYTTATNSNRLLSITNPAQSFSYDAAGNQLTGTAISTYNNEGRLAKMVVGSASFEAAYDALGQRVRKKITSPATTTTTHLVYDLSGHLIGEYLSDGSASMEYIWLADLPIAAVRTAGTGTPEVFYIHADHLGAPRVAVDQQNRLRWRWAGEPFGAWPAEANPSNVGELKLSLRFPGQQYDEFIGTHYNYFRDYDPTTGRYVQSDPIGLQGGVNTYAYVDDNPLNYSDPLGLFTTLNHVSITIAALRQCGFTYRRANELAWAAAAGDWTPSWKVSQSIGSANWHAMARPRQSVSDARRSTEAFIKVQLAFGTTESIGRAIHAAQDSAARGHKGYQTYTGYSDLNHLAGDEFPSPAEIRDAIQKTKALFPECRCK
ncbi:RHS repeat-associated core domain-containing protein [Pelomonas sp. SE-A7]|uniref:RHS repeat-associated core domain-containing protein n=1 Tax=Pelomonas sp. SE-A7 TaxID=3054953 RepID=UPI00259CEF86|nr:RHS repeat-associated core domain-containing protein [Pelomonas sp. SE-A7]MDM4766845.1 RHS repeat-associated core domain-containing protein [Pelomonas sp. SE-A7]